MGIRFTNEENGITVEVVPFFLIHEEFAGLQQQILNVVILFSEFSFSYMFVFRVLVCEFKLECIIIAQHISQVSQPRLRYWREISSANHTYQTGYFKTNLLLPVLALVCNRLNC